MNSQQSETIPSIKRFGSSIGFSPAIGFSSVTQREVSEAKEFLVSKIFDCCYPNSDKTMGLYQSIKLGHPYRFSSIDLVQSINLMEENQDVQSAKFYFKTHVDVIDLNNNDPLNHLLQKLSKDIFNLGFIDTKTGMFEIRFEKGCLNESVASNWHFDEGYKTSITVCWSNIDSWSTKILNLGKCPEDLRPLKKLKRISKADICYNDNKCQENAIFGGFYNALTTCHRAPKEGDVDDLPLSASDFRLFVRYTEDK